MPKVKSSPVIPVAASIIDVAIGPPQLFWLTIDTHEGFPVEQMKTPNAEQIWMQNRDDFDQSSKAFWGKALNAHSIRIMDTHFGTKEMRFLRDKLEGAKSLKVLKIFCSSDKKSIEAERARYFEDLKEFLRLNDKNKQIEMKVFKNGRFPFLHDRFAAIDNELWHFGSTVGGLHNSLTAYSRGWDAKDHNFIDLFNLAWERCEHD
jgi:hypothetical protein